MTDDIEDRMTDDIPQWALKKARELRDEEFDLTRSLCPMKHAFARYIASHEEPPVDPVIDAARQIVADENERHGCTETAREVRRGRRDHHTEFRIAAAALRRGMELAREQSA